MEWLFEAEELRFLVATTTIAQGVNSLYQVLSWLRISIPMVRICHPRTFGTLPASRAYFTRQPCVVALVADSPSKAGTLRQFINNQSGDLNSALISLAHEAGEKLGDLRAIVYSNPEWSSFVQYLAHTYRQWGSRRDFRMRLSRYFGIPLALINYVLILLLWRITY